LLQLGTGSSLRHWPPGTNSKTFVPSFFARELAEEEISFDGDASEAGAAADGFD